MIQTINKDDSLAQYCTRELQNGRHLDHVWGINVILLSLPFLTRPIILHDSTNIYSQTIVNNQIYFVFKLKFISLYLVQTQHLTNSMFRETLTVLNSLILKKKSSVMFKEQFHNKVNTESHINNNTTNQYGIFELSPGPKRSTWYRLFRQSKSKQIFSCHSLHSVQTSTLSLN